MKAIAIIGIAALTALGLSACDNGACKADGASAAPVSIVQKGGGGGGGGGGHAGGGGGHAGGEGAGSGGHEGESTGGGSAPHVPVVPGHSSETCKGKSA